MDESKSKELKTLLNTKKMLESRIASIKSEIEKDLNIDNITYYTDNLFTIKYRNTSVTTTLDVNRIEKVDPELYKSLLEKYSKVTKRAGCFMYTERKLETNGEHK